MNETSTTPAVKESGIENFCTAVGTFMLIGIALVMVVGFGMGAGSAGGIVRLLAIAVALLLSAGFWFAIARVLHLLAQIAHNTRRS